MVHTSFIKHCFNKILGKYTFYIIIIRHTTAYQLHASYNITLDLHNTQQKMHITSAVSGIYTVMNNYQRMHYVCYMIFNIKLFSEFIACMKFLKCVNYILSNYLTNFDGFNSNFDGFNLISKIIAVLWWITCTKYC